MRNPFVYIFTLFLHRITHLESQVELTGMLSSCEQCPLPIPPRKTIHCIEKVTKYEQDFIQNFTIRHLVIRLDHHLL